MKSPERTSPTALQDRARATIVSDPDSQPNPNPLTKGRWADRITLQLGGHFHVAATALIHLRRAGRERAQTAVRGSVAASGSSEASIVAVFLRSSLPQPA